MYKRTSYNNVLNAVQFLFRFTKHIAIRDVSSSWPPRAQFLPFRHLILFKMGLRITFQAQTIKVHQCSLSVENNMHLYVPIPIFSFSPTESPYFWIFSSSENKQNLDRYQRKSTLAGSHFEVNCRSRSMSTKSIACRTPNLLQWLLCWESWCGLQRRLRLVLTEFGTYRSAIWSLPPITTDVVEICCVENPWDLVWLFVVLYEIA